ncbi:MAG: hypothetical protein R3B47_19360 [Bacteroidia bacterium]
MTTHTWIYTLSQNISAETRQALGAAFQAFLNAWKTHGTPVKGAISIQYDRFVIVQADPADDKPSGCSIDSMRHAVEEILQQARLQWLDNGQVAFRASSGEIETVPFQQVPSLLAEGRLNPETVVFDNSLSHTDDLAMWERPLAETWMKRYLVSQ